MDGSILALKIPDVLEIIDKTAFCDPVTCDECKHYVNGECTEKFGKVFCIPGSYTMNHGERKNESQKEQTKIKKCTDCNRKISSCYEIEKERCTNCLVKYCLRRVEEEVLLTQDITTDGTVLVDKDCITCAVNKVLSEIS